MTQDSLDKRLKAFTQSRDWEQFHTPNIIDNLKGSLKAAKHCSAVILTRMVLN